MLYIQQHLESQLCVKKKEKKKDLNPHLPVAKTNSVMLMMMLCGI